MDIRHSFLSIKSFLYYSMESKNSIFGVLALTCLLGATAEDECSCTYVGKTNTLDVQCKDSSRSREYEQCFANYTQAEILYFTNSSLTDVPEQLDLFLNLTQLDLSDNNITTLSFENNTHACKKLHNLNIASNRIRSLRIGSLMCLESIKYLSLKRNGLKLIENGTFNWALKHLKYIDISYNHLNSLDTSLFFRRSGSSVVFSNVNATQNDINIFTNFGRLNITDVTPAVSFLVTVMHNNVTGINPEYYLNMVNITNPAQIYRFLNTGFDLRFNPFHCDCDLYPFASTLRKFRFMDPDNPVFGITCYYPPSLREVLIYEVKDFQFNCTVVKDCPPGCACTHTIALNLTSIVCNEMFHELALPAQLPKAEHIRLSISSHAFSRLSDRPYLSNATVLDLSGSSLSAIAVDVLARLDNITTVNLHDNSLKYMPKEITQLKFTNLTTLTIHGNPYVCDCHTVWLKKWIESENVTSHIPHQNKITCGGGYPRGKAMLTVPDSDFKCVMTLTTAQLIAICVGCVVLVIIVVLLLFRYRRRFCTLASRHGRQRMGGGDKTRVHFDVYIAYSSRDEDVVVDVVSKLESHDPPYRVNISTRDFVAGNTIAENIREAVESSRITVMFLSRGFLASDWCNFEFDLAQKRYYSRQAGGGGLIVVLLEELTEIPMTSSMSMYMREHDCLRYGTDQFWDRLMAALSSAGETDPTEKTPLISV